MRDFYFLSLMWNLNFLTFVRHFYLHSFFRCVDCDSVFRYVYRLSFRHLNVYSLSFIGNIYALLLFRNINRLFRLVSHFYLYFAFSDFYRHLFMRHFYSLTFMLHSNGYARILRSCLLSRHRTGECRTERSSARGLFDYFLEFTE